MIKFRIYRNLHKGNFSIQSYIKEKKGYRVTDRVSTAVFEKCSFTVSEPSRQKVIREGRKNVHAYINSESYRVVNSCIDVSKFREIYYNPYIYDSFIYKDDESKVFKVENILTHNNKIYDVGNYLIQNSEKTTHSTD
jgi:hypothetical protein